MKKEKVFYAIHSVAMKRRRHTKHVLGHPPCPDCYCDRCIWLTRIREGHNKLNPNKKFLDAF